MGQGMSAADSMTKDHFSFLFEEIIKSDDVIKIKKFCFEFNNTNFTDRQGRSLLFLSCKYNAEKIFNFLIQNGADVNFIFFSDDSALLHTTCTSGNLEMVKLLAERGKRSNLDRKNTTGLTPFMIACKEGHAEIAQYLYEIGADTRCREHILDMSAYDLACVYRRKNVIDFFQKKMDY